MQRLSRGQARPVGIERQEIHEPDAERLADDRQRCQRRVALPSLDLANELVAEPGALGELLLSKPLGTAELFQAATKPST